MAYIMEGGGVLGVRPVYAKEGLNATLTSRSRRFIVRAPKDHIHIRGSLRIRGPIFRSPHKWGS